MLKNVDPTGSTVWDPCRYSTDPGENALGFTYYAGLIGRF